MATSRSNSFGNAEETDTDSVEGAKPAKSQLYKTELCKSFIDRATCRYGSKCQFAHGIDELRSTLKHPKYKTINCKTYWKNGVCPYGSRCRFLHADERDGSEDGDAASGEERESLSDGGGNQQMGGTSQHPKYKTEMCISWTKYGSCSYGTRYEDRKLYLK